MRRMSQALAQPGSRRERIFKMQFGGFLEASAQLGTPDETLEEAGYELEGETWRALQLISLDMSTISVERM
jgi:hypothetical protein